MTKTKRQRNHGGKPKIPVTKLKQIINDEIAPLACSPFLDPVIKQITDAVVQ